MIYGILTENDIGTLFTMLIGAILFATFLTVTRAPQAAVDALSGLALPAWGILCLLPMMYFVRGWFLDALAMIIIITVPIVYPVIIQLGHDPIWFGVIKVIACEMGLVTPPYGINVFVINAVVPQISIPRIFGVAAALVPAMRAQGWGQIVNLSSAAILNGHPNYLHYVASTAALQGMTRSMARELAGSGVTDDLAGLVVWLASTASDFATGQSFIIDGGFALN